jgi:quercetin dioxygenase-like cupin family protein
MMKTAWHFLMIGVGVVAGGALAAPALAMEGHKVVPAQEVEWGPGPAALPPGAEAAALLGDSSKEGLFVTQIRFPKGYHIPPHTHPQVEVVTVLSGAFALGMGETADQSKAQPLAAGSFFALPPGTAHYVFIDEETVIQINTIGPAGFDYVNPEDDPRKQSQ